MDSNHVFLGGVMWCRFGQKDAGKELPRAADSMDSDMTALACDVGERCAPLEGVGKASANLFSRRQSPSNPVEASSTSNLLPSAPLYTRNSYRLHARFGP